MEWAKRISRQLRRQPVQTPSNPASWAVSWRKLKRYVISCFDKYNAKLKKNVFAVVFGIFGSAGIAVKKSKASSETDSSRYRLRCHMMLKKLDSSYWSKITLIPTFLLNSWMPKVCLTQKQLLASSRSSWRATKTSPNSKRSENPACPVGIVLITLSHFIYWFISSFPDFENISSHHMDACSWPQLTWCVVMMRSRVERGCKEDNGLLTTSF